MKYLLINIFLFSVFRMLGQKASDYYNQAKIKEGLKDYTIVTKAK